MGRNVRTRRIEASPDRVYSAFTDPGMMADWMELAEIRDVTGSLDTPGSHCVMVWKGPWKFRSEILRADRPGLHQHAGRGPLGASYRMTATLTPVGAGTGLKVETGYTYPFGPVGRLLERLFERGAPANANRELDRLVALVSGAWPD